MLENIEPVETQPLSRSSYANTVRHDEARGDTTLSTIAANKVRSKLSSTNVDPSLSVIIKNVQSSKFRNSSNCKSQFNKHFQYMRIKSIFSTQAGNIIVELFEKKDVDRVLNEWQGNFFCPTVDQNAISSTTKLTTVTLMKNSNKRTEIVIKGVSKYWSEEEIKEELKLSHNMFPEPTVKRFIKRNGEVLNTVKVTFKYHEDLLKAIRQGVFLQGEHFNVEPFKSKPRAHQCFKCKHYGHPAKWCTRKVRCEYCATEGHEGRDCIIRGEIHEYCCANCKGNHSATYYECPEYVRHLRVQNNNSSSHNDCQ